MRGALRLCTTVGGKISSLSLRPGRRRHTGISAGRQSATSRGASFEDDRDIRGKDGGTERKWVTGDCPELLHQLAEKLAPPLRFPVM